MSIYRTRMIERTLERLGKRGGSWTLKTQVATLPDKSFRSLSQVK